MHGGEVFEELFLDAVTVGAGQHDKLERDGGWSEATGFEIAGVGLDVGAADVGKRIELVVTAPGEPQTQLGGVRLAGSR